MSKYPLERFPTDDGAPASTELALIADTSVVPAFDLESMLATDERFERLTELAREKNFTPQTIESIQAVRQRWASERAGVWNSFDYVADFAENSGDPDFEEKLYRQQEETTEKVLDAALHGDEKKKRYWFGFGEEDHTLTPDMRLEKWLSHNGLSDYGRTASLREEITHKYSVWLEANKNEVLETTRPLIRDLSLFDEGMSIPNAAIRVQRTFATKYLKQYDDLLDEALDKSTDHLEQMDAFEYSAVPKKRAVERLIHWATSNEPEFAPDLGARDHKALSGFFALIRNLTVLGSHINAEYVKQEMADEFDGETGYAAYKLACTLLADRAKTELLYRVGADQAEEFLEQFESRIEDIWAQDRYRYRRTDDAPKKERPTPKPRNTEENEKSLRTEYTEMTSHDRISFNVAETNADNALGTIPAESVAQIGEYMDNATTKFWRTAFNDQIIAAFVNQLNVLAQPANKKFEPRKVFRSLSSQFHPDRATTEDGRDRMEEMIREVNGLWTRFDDGHIMISRSNGNVVIKMSDIDLRE